MDVLLDLAGYRALGMRIVHAKYTFVFHGFINIAKRNGFRFNCEQRTALATGLRSDKSGFLQQADDSANHHGIGRKALGHLLRAEALPLLDRQER